MNLNETVTRAKLIDPKLKERIWDENFIVRKYYYTDGRKLLGNKCGKKNYIDYLLK